MLQALIHVGIQLRVRDRRELVADWADQAHLRASGEDLPVSLDPLVRSEVPRAPPLVPAIRIPAAAMPRRPRPGGNKRRVVRARFSPTYEVSCLAATLAGLNNDSTNLDRPQQRR